jgi:hypothetical protein
MANLPMNSSGYFLGQSTNRGIFLLGPKYFKMINPDRVVRMVKTYGDPVQMTDLQVDDLKWALLTGTSDYYEATAV